jgi:hypothetical protein
MSEEQQIKSNEIRVLTCRKINRSTNCGALLDLISL